MQTLIEQSITLTVMITMTDSQWLISSYIYSSMIGSRVVPKCQMTQSRRFPQEKPKQKVVALRNANRHSKNLAVILALILWQSGVHFNTR